MLTSPRTSRHRRRAGRERGWGAALTQPRRGKSFRAAADRIVRDEWLRPTIATRLLGPTPPAATEIRGDEDEWAARLGALATLGQYDALAVCVDEPATLGHAHNVRGDVLD